MTDGLQKHHKKPKYKKYKDSRCRTDEGKQGKTGEQYDTYNYIPYQYDKDKCEEKCSGDPSCTGYEFKKHRVCEIWHEKSKKHKTHKEKGAYCYWKEEEKIEPHDVLRQPFKNQYYYGYKGSLTVPPCSDFVLWYIVDNPMDISPSQLRRLRDLIKDYINDDCEKGTYADENGNVNRPLQTKHKHSIFHCDESDYIN